MIRCRPGPVVVVVVAKTIIEIDRPRPAIEAGALPEAHGARALA
jgi:hypothetical protein